MQNKEFEAVATLTRHPARLLRTHLPTVGRRGLHEERRKEHLYVLPVLFHPMHHMCGTLFWEDLSRARKLSCGYWGRAFEVASQLQ